MKTLSASLKALVVASMACAAGFAAAAGTSDQLVPVTATVAAVCRISTAAKIDFGPIDQTVAGDKTVDVTIPYKCTKGVKPTITTGTITDLTNGTDTMAFTLGAFTTVAATGFSNSVDGTSSATIAESVWQNVSAGSYAGSVVLNINY